MKPKFKGTPGPWKICCYGHEYKELVIEKDKKPETRVANVAIQEIFESLANARLIAAGLYQLRLRGHSKDHCP